VVGVLTDQVGAARGSERPHATLVSLRERA
jgi:hypothetical protein